MPDRRDENHIARQELGVPGFVSAQDEVIQVEFGHHLVAALQLDLAHRSVVRRPAGREQCVDQRGQRTDDITAGLARLPHHIDLDRAQLAERGVEFEVLVNAADRAANQGIQVLIGQTGNIDRADFRHVDAAVPVDDGAIVDVDLPPCTDINLVTRSEDIVAWHGNLVHRGERARRAGKKAVAVERQFTPQRPCNELFEFQLRALRARLRAVAVGAWLERLLCRGRRTCALGILLLVLLQLLLLAGCQRRRVRNIGRLAGLSRHTAALELLD